MISIAALVVGTTAAPADYIASLENAPELTLERAQKLALSENFDFRIAREQMQRAAYLSEQAFAFVLPTVNANYNLIRNNQEIQLQIPGAPEPVTIQNLWQQNAAVTFNWTVLNGRSVPLILNAYDIEEQSVLVFENQRETLSYNVALAFYNAITAGDEVDIQERALELAKSNFELASARAELGSATPVDSLRAEVAVATAEQDLLQAQIRKQLADRALAVLINEVDEDGQITPYRLVRPPEQRLDKVDLLDRALSQRYDLQFRELDVTIQERYVDETKLKWLPELVVSGAYNWSDVGGFAGNNTTWNVVFGVQWALFEGGTTFWELQQRKHDVETAAILYEQTKIAIANGVRQSELNLDNAVSNFDAAERRVELARRSAELASAQFEVGQATQLDVLDANRQLADAESQQALARLAVAIARLEVERVIKIDPMFAGGN